MEWRNGAACLKAPPDTKLAKPDRDDTPQATDCSKSGRKDDVLFRQAKAECVVNN
jgi:hypothetical protein